MITPFMQLGFFTAILPDQTLAEVLQFAAANRFDCLEVACWPGGGADRKFAGACHIAVDGLTQAGADDIHALRERHGVNFSALGYYPNPLDPDLAAAVMAIRHLEKVVLAAELLGLRQVNTFVGRNPALTVDDNWPRLLEVWRPLLAFAADHGVRVGIENCPMSFGLDEWPGGKNLATSPVIWRRMFNDLSAPNFGLNYDPSHFVLQRMDPLSPLREFKDRLFHVHAKDMIVHQEKLNEVGIFALPKEWHTPRIPGFGEIDWAAFMAALYQTGYRGPVCVEVEDPTFGHDLAGRQRALRVAGNVLRPYFG